MKSIATAGHIVLPTIRTIDVQIEGEDVVILIDGVSRLRGRWSVMEITARNLKQLLRLRPQGAQRLSLGFPVPGGKPWQTSLPVEQVRLLQSALYQQCKRAEANTWAEVDKHFTDGVKVHRVLGTPVLDDRAHLERV